MSARQPEHSGDVTDVRVVATLDPAGIYNRVWQPFIERWSENHLLLAYGLHLRGKTDMGDIVCSVSTDDGDSWQPPVTIFDHRERQGALRFAYANPVLFHPPGQDVVWCYAMRCPMNYRDSEDAGLCGAYSADGGRSWIPVELAVNHHSQLITCAGVIPWPVGAGETRYLLPVHRNTLRHDPLGRQDQFVLESTNLTEWKLAGYIPHTPEPQIFAHEGNIARWGENGLKIVMRTATYGRKPSMTDPPNAWSSESTDGGRTWSQMAPEPELYNAICKAYFGEVSPGSHDGGHIYVFSPGPAGERKGLHYRVRRDGQWGEERVFFDGDYRNSYPTLLERAPGEFYAVWDSSHSVEEKRTAIRFGKLSV